MVPSLKSCPTFWDPWLLGPQDCSILGISQQEDWFKAKLFPPPTDLPDPKIKLISPELAGDGTTWEAHHIGIQGPPIEKFPED